MLHFLKINFQNFQLLSTGTLKMPTKKIFLSSKRNSCSQLSRHFLIILVSPILHSNNGLDLVIHRHKDYTSILCSPSSSSPFQDTKLLVHNVITPGWIVLGLERIAGEGEQRKDNISQCLPMADLGSSPAAP